MTTVAQRCARCGRPVEPGEHLCASCREEAPLPPSPTDQRPPRPRSEQEERASRWPAGMPRPSPVQYHATVMVAVFLVLVGLAVFAFWSHHGVGPFEGKVQQFTVPPGGSLVVVATVQNQGSKAARATCRITALDTSDTPEGAETVLTEQIPAGGTVTLRHEFADVTVPPASVSITCT